MKDLPGDVRRFLSAVSLFEGMGDGEIEELVQMVRPFERSLGQALFHQGDPSDGMYIIGRGAVEIRARVPGDASMTLARLTGGAVLGEVSLLDRGVRSATAVALESTTGYWLGRRHFEFLRRDMKPATLTLMRRLIGITCASVRRSYGRIEALVDSAQSSHGGRGPRPGTEHGSLAQVGVSEIPFEALPLFARLSEAERQGVLDVSRVVQAPRGASLYVQGAEATEVLMVLRGAARTVLGQAARAFPVAVHAPGSMVGIVGALDGGTHATSSFAVEPSVLLTIPRGALGALRSEAVPRSWHINEHLHDNLVQVLRRCTDHAARLELERHLRAGRTGGDRV